MLGSGFDGVIVVGRWSPVVGTKSDVGAPVIVAIGGSVEVESAASTVTVGSRVVGVAVSTGVIVGTNVGGDTVVVGAIVGSGAVGEAVVASEVGSLVVGDTDGMFEGTAVVGETVSRTGD